MGASAPLRGPAELAADESWELASYLSRVHLFACCLSPVACRLSCQLVAGCLLRPRRLPLSSCLHVDCAFFLSSESPSEIIVGGRLQFASRFQLSAPASTSSPCFPSSFQIPSVKRESKQERRRERKKEREEEKKKRKEKKKMANVKDMFSLEGQTALITGGTRGIGQAVAVALAEAGADVLLVQVRQTRERVIS
jgi:hypothetical protein